MFNLTREERRVVLFLAALALAGLGIDFLAKQYSPVRAIARFSQDIGKIDLNSADKDLLMSIPGIGEKLARRIIEYREKQTSFTSLEELKNIKGIPESKCGKMKDYLTIK
ncbi:MAG: helix-hairpin-helix domain-containing protein [Candidatus Omnitrophota bacterium]